MSESLTAFAVHRLLAALLEGAANLCQSVVYIFFCTVCCDLQFRLSAHSLSLYRADCAARCLPGVVVALNVIVLLLVAVTVRLLPLAATPTLTVLEQRMQM